MLTTGVPICRGKTEGSFDSFLMNTETFTNKSFPRGGVDPNRPRVVVVRREASTSPNGGRGPPRVGRKCVSQLRYFVALRRVLFASSHCSFRRKV